jgi:hypothetical protein
MEVFASRCSARYALALSEVWRSECGSWSSPARATNRVELTEPNRRNPETIIMVNLNLAPRPQPNFTQQSSTIQRGWILTAGCCCRGNPT